FFDLKRLKLSSPSSVSSSPFRVKLEEAEEEEEQEQEEKEKEKKSEREEKKEEKKHSTKRGRDSNAMEIPLLLVDQSGARLIETIQSTRWNLPSKAVVTSLGIVDKRGTFLDWEIDDKPAIERATVYTKDGSAYDGRLVAS